MKPKNSQNLPTLRGGEAIVAAIEHLSQQFRTQFQNLNQRFDRFETRVEIKFDRLQTQMRASETNNLARIQNSHLSTPLSDITLLVYISTTAEVLGFPATSRYITRMEEPELDAVIQGLGVAPATGSLASKRSKSYWARRLNRRQISQQQLYSIWARAVQE
ncbi:hypothetical protein HRR83_009217 [Exophiala dermatitidis]|uniref:Uncharacterized protein n=1 Tax=Exophiala dermatitidis TaxID=5970 RepID=A0AAN6ET14_EXODE|nr:hypothetical protein HRR73_009242 [Exophiala dermatitidis]KAJ4503391.1 hypothetical protein HRR74_009298 [Exophiala dermatitidis]KAJ4535412.1 hypothetical protein HRR77_008027 [Exophiala dermatitidis]KAJ4540707.1 hypothetical protein HRR76_004095 [Exophiala dermatitidis]KAJ4561842.1 hypothetical protein HRR81_009271 [Exophiala dermatitidis]